MLCYARHLQAELESGKLEYDIEVEDNVQRIITSDYFDAYVNGKGDRIEISANEITHIQTLLNKTLDSYYEKTITLNRNITKKIFEPHRNTIRLLKYL